jgi:RimK family alpha-L-glutamate ligase
MKFAVVAHRRSATNNALVTAAHSWGLDAELLEPKRALSLLDPGDLALARLDVREGLDGIERGTGELELLAASGVDVRNPPAALVVAHDKLLTARTLRLAGLPHPHTTLISPAVLPELPLVLKPRFGSWGRDVERCSTADELDAALLRLRRKPWFREHGALAQELIEPRGWDLRLVVAGGRVVGCACRIARKGEWRTNVALGAQVEGVEPSPIAEGLALAAARAARADLVGVDLLPTRNGFVVIELNGAVDYRPEYAPGRDVFSDTIAALLEDGVQQRALAAASVGRLVRLRLQARLDLAAAVGFVGHVDQLVRAVRPGDPEPHRQPAPEAEPPFLLERAGEDERSALHVEVSSGNLADAADVDLEDLWNVVRQFNPRALRHPHRMPFGCAAS